MDPTRIHLFITHLPVFGIFLAFFSLLFGYLRRDKGVKIISLAIMVVAIGGGLIAFQTGESAEDKVEHIAEVSHDAVEVHEESGELTNVFLIALGLLTAFGLYAEVNDKRFSRIVIVAILILSAATFFMVARTALLGGKIRHTEINS